jgi:Tol biopolymer transport system component
MKRVLLDVRRLCALTVAGLVGCQATPTEPSMVAGASRTAASPVAPERLSFVGEEAGSEDGQLYWAWSDGPGLTQITHFTAGTTNHSWEASWSPPANRIVFRREQAIYNNSYGYDYHVGAIDIDGTDYQDLTPAGVAYALEPVWSPDGAKVVFEDGAFTPMLKVVNADGSGLTQVGSAAGR